MVKLNFTKTTIEQLEKQAELNESNSVEAFLEEKTLLMLVNTITAPDVENTKKTIKKAQDDLNAKRKEIMSELLEEKDKKEVN